MSIRDVLHKVNLHVLSPAIMDVNLTLDEIEEEKFRWPRGQDKVTSRCVHVLGFVYGKQNEMPVRVVVPSSCHRALGTTSMCMNTRCVLQEDSSENDEVFKSTLFFPCGKTFVHLQTCALFINYLCFFLTFHHVRLTNNSGLSLRSTDGKSTLTLIYFPVLQRGTWPFGLHLDEIIILEVDYRVSCALNG